MLLFREIARFHESIVYECSKFMARYLVHVLYDVKQAEAHAKAEIWQIHEACKR